MVPFYPARDGYPTLFDPEDIAAGEIYSAIERLGADDELLAFIGSVDDAEVLTVCATTTQRTGRYTGRSDCPRRQSRRHEPAPALSVISPPPHK